MRIMRILENFKINISNAVFKTTKGTEVYTCWQGIPHANNSFSKIPVASRLLLLLCDLNSF